MRYVHLYYSLYIIYTHFQAHPCCLKSDGAIRTVLRGHSGGTVDCYSHFGFLGFLLSILNTHGRLSDCLTVRLSRPLIIEAMILTTRRVGSLLMRNKISIIPHRCSLCVQAKPLSSKSSIHFIKENACKYINPNYILHFGNAFSVVALGMTVNVASTLKNQRFREFLSLFL